MPAAALSSVNPCYIWIRTGITGKDRIDEDQRKIATKQYADLVAVTNLEIPHNSIRDSNY